VSAQQPRWTIAELGRKVADALATANYEGPANGQVRAVPNERSIRYYTTLGLLDRPLEIRGRTALYGPRHLMQLVAIKRLQARGHSLAEVQAMLSGASHRKLVRIADVPRAVWAGDEPPEAPGAHDAGQAHDAHALEAGASPAAAALPDRTRFWDAVPAEAPAQMSGVAPDVLGDVPGDVPGDVSGDVSGVDSAVTLAGRPSDDALPAPGAPVLLASMALAPGVTLLFQPARPADASDAEALRQAAARLVAELQARGLVRSPGSDSEPDHAPVARAAHDQPTPTGPQET
jgi:DNA-binding transcriptional MerR regulator